MDVDGHISSHQQYAHYTRWQHHFAVPKSILDDFWPYFLGDADGVYFQYGNAFSTVSLLMVIVTKPVFYTQCRSKRLTTLTILVYVRT